MESRTIKIQCQSIDELARRLGANEKFIKECGFQAWLEKIGQSNLIPRYRKTQGLPILKPKK